MRTGLVRGGRRPCELKGEVGGGGEDGGNGDDGGWGAGGGLDRGFFDGPLGRSINLPLSVPSSTHSCFHTFSQSSCSDQTRGRTFSQIRAAEGSQRVGERGLDRGSLAGEFHLHHLKGKEGISCIPLSFFELLKDVRALPDCRVVDPFGIDT
jgi:hypothetical protein